MAWYSSSTVLLGSIYHWETQNISGATALSVKPEYSLSTLQWRDTGRQFKSDKTYVYKTYVRHLDSINSGMSFSINSIWGDKFQISTQSLGNNLTYLPFTSTQSGYLYFYSKPNSNSNSNNYVYYQANGNFGSGTSPSPGIISLDVSELNWDVNGFIYCDNGTNQNFSTSSHSLGWKYVDTPKPGYIWFDDSVSTFYPVGGSNNSKTSNINFRENNFISKFISYQFCNFYFDYTKINGGLTDGIKIYLSQSPPVKTTSTDSFLDYLNSSTILAEINDIGNVQGTFYNITGGQYIVVVANKSATYSTILLSGLRIEGGYHPGNNEIYTTALPSLTTTIQGATYSAYVGNGNTVNATSSLVVNQIYSKIGNGNFKSGLWENGVWNNGWREDEVAFDFDDIDISIRSVSDVRWRWRVIGPSASVSKFEVGDIVSIGNIVAIDINGDRRLLKNAFQVISASASGINNRIGYITIEADTTFPFRRIKKDSTNHKIKVTKNVWLSGAFLNGYFTGVWNYGLFRGYPLITEMYDTHWIDGKFEGGHFNSENFAHPNFVETVFYNGKVGLTFSTPHGLAVGDVITIDKTNKSVNPQYDGETTVIEVPSDTFIITDLNWGQNTTYEAGKITTDLHTGVVQSMTFESQNISNITSNNSLESSSVFIYNSWMDVQYDNTSATNIGKPQTLINQVSDKSYSDNNLYGYITKDILSSNSSFRDSFSNRVRRYKLGTKYKVFSDYIGDSGLFENYFNIAGTSSQSQTFLDQGWTYSWSNGSSITFSRTVDSGQDLITGKELKVEAYKSGGILDLSIPNVNVNNRDNSEIEKSRYTAIEFDMLTYSVTYDTFYQQKSKFANNYIQSPLIHFNNLNIVSRPSTIGTLNINILLYSTYLPIYQNVNHLRTPKTRKIEYFYNKRNLAMHFRGSYHRGIYPSTFVIDNLKFYEIDMVPFFQYFTEENINIGVQIPLQGIAPYIDYGTATKGAPELYGSDSNFVFLDNINIGLDSFSITSQFGLYSGVGPGIGSSYQSGGIFDS